jgi:integrase
LIADVLNIYATDRGALIVRRAELGQRLTALLDYWGRMTLADVDGHQCRAYATQRRSQAMARRELEDLRAAIRHHRREGYHREVIEVVLPEKGRPRERWLTRSEAARLIWAAWRFREKQGGKPTDRASRQHVARFVLVGLYTGTRAGAICGAALTPTIGRGYVDLERGLFHRRALGAKETRKRQPAIQIPTRLLAHLRRWARIGVARRAVVEFNGEPVQSVRKAFSRTAEDAGLKGVSPHVLRHSAASWAMQNGADVDRTAEYLGMTRQVLLRVYGHLRPDHLREVGEAITGKPTGRFGQLR